MERFAKCVTLIGVGGVGGPIAREIARLVREFDCKRFIIYDFDVVEHRNVQGGQIYTREDLGRLKVEALQHFFYNLDLGDCKVEYRAEKVARDTPLRGIVIVAVDNLEARQEIFEALSYQSGKGNHAPLLIEARVGDNTNYGLIYVLNPNDPEQMARYRPEVFWEQEQNNNTVEVNDLCISSRIGAVFGGAVAEVLVRFWNKWRPLKLKLGTIDFGYFAEVHWADVE